MVPERKLDDNFMKDRKIHFESNVWSTAQRSQDLTLMFSLNETIYQLAMANSFRWYGNVLRRDHGHVLRMALDFEVEGPMEESVKVSLEWQMHFEKQSGVLALIVLLLVEVNLATLTCWDTTRF